MRRRHSSAVPSVLVPSVMYDWLSIAARAARDGGREERGNSLVSIVVRPSLRRMGGWGSIDYDRILCAKGSDSGSQADRPCNHKC
jgi:hypothetical protein